MFCVTEEMLYVCQSGSFVASTFAAPKTINFMMFLPLPSQPQPILMIPFQQQLREHMYYMYLWLSM